MLVASITSQLARRDFLFSDHEQVLTAPEDLCTIRAQNCALFLLTHNAPNALFDERVLADGAALYAELALRRLANGRC